MFSGIPLSSEGTSSEPYRHSFFVRTIIDWNHLEDDIVDAPSTEALRERLANIQPDYLHSLISVQSTGRTRSSSLITLARPPVSSSLGLQITNRSLHICNTLPVESVPFLLRQPHSVHFFPGSPHPAHITSSQSPSSLSSPITPSTFHSRLKTKQCPFNSVQVKIRKGISLEGKRVTMEERICERDKFFVFQQDNAPAHRQATLCDFSSNAGVHSTGSLASKQP